MPLPSELTVVPVHGRWLKDDGTAESGTVGFVPSVRQLAVPAANTIVTLEPFEATLDANGEVTVQLPATDDADVTPTGWTWQVQERLSQASRDRRISVPSATPDTLQLADIADAVPGPAVVSYALAAAVVAKAGNNQIVLTEDLTYGFADVNINHPNPTVDAFAFRFLGARTGYHNELGEVRGVAAKDTTVAARFRRKSAGSTANIFEVANENNVPFVYVEADGTLRSPNLDALGWQAVEFEANAGAGHLENGEAFGAARSRIESLESGRVGLEGAVGLTGTINSGTPFMTLHEDHWPSVMRAVILRTSAPTPPGGGSSVQARMRIDRNGECSINSNLTSGTNIHLDGLFFTL